MKILDRGVIGTIFELGVEFAPTGFRVADQTTSHPKVPIQSPLDLALTIFKRNFLWGFDADYSAKHQ